MLDKTTSTPALTHERPVKTRPEMDPADAGPTPASIDDLSWKASRKLKQQRDLQKRRHAIHGKDRLPSSGLEHHASNVEVAKELNMLFLNRSRHYGGVFEFENDEPHERQSRQLPNCKLLAIDLLKFQVSLSSMLFGKNDEPLELPLSSSSGLDLVDVYITEPWIAKTMLNIVKLDVIAQYDAFAVMLACFRAFPSRRRSIMKSVVGSCLAIFEHQAMEQMAGSTARSRKFVSMKGVIEMLNGILAVTEQELAEDSSNLGESQEAVEEYLGETCDSIFEAIKLLARCSPGKNSSPDENNRIETLQEGSDSVEATTIGALRDLLSRLTAFSPVHGEHFLTWMLRKWPQRNVQLQLFFVRFMTAVLVQFMMGGLILPHDVVTRAFSRLRTCIRSPHFLIAQEASSVCGNLQLMDMYISPDHDLREQVASALHENATGHWNDRIRQMSDEYFDLLLDLA
ncbi:hypothetical protein ATCC90586_001226 [Pythium insidiosum]|nr:hypothetical protein ATCC90586_001226 [Pythium insidiosum]